MSPRNPVRLRRRAQSKQSMTVVRRPTKLLRAFKSTAYAIETTGSQILPLSEAQPVGKVMQLCVRRDEFVRRSQLSWFVAFPFLGPGQVFEYAIRTLTFLHYSVCNTYVGADVCCDVQDGSCLQLLRMSLMALLEQRLSRASGRRQCHCAEYSTPNEHTSLERWLS